MLTWCVIRNYAVRALGPFAKLQKSTKQTVKITRFPWQIQRTTESWAVQTRKTSPIHRNGGLSFKFSSFQHLSPVNKEAEKNNPKDEPKPEQNSSKKKKSKKSSKSDKPGEVKKDDTKNDEQQNAEPKIEEVNTDEIPAAPVIPAPDKPASIAPEPPQKARWFNN